MYIDIKMDNIETCQDTILFEGINLDKDDFTTLESMLADKFMQGDEIADFTKKVNMSCKTITIKGKDFKKVG